MNNKEKNKLASQTILFVKSEVGFITQAITKNLEDVGFNVIETGDNLDEINYNSSFADMILYYVSGSKEIIAQRMSLLTDICNEFNKTLCIAGEERCVSEAQNTENRQRIVGVYKRPIDMRELVSGVFDQFSMHMEYERTKTILLVDDDIDFISIAALWLDDDYKVDGVNSGKEALRYLDKHRPDLILLDYDMPEIDGYELFDKIKKNPLIAHIPIIFLTGKNDRESVMKIINRKPDGYLLKSMGRTELLNSIDSFFIESTLSV